MRYSDEDYRRCKEADIRDFIPDLHGRGNKVYTTCPFCGKEKGLVYDAKHNGFHCFHCDKHISGPIGAVMQFDGVNEGEAIRRVAQRLNILSMEEKRASDIESYRKRIKKSFCEKQLEASGLTADDVAVKTVVNGAVMYAPAFRPGGKDKAGNINDTDDEMLIYYYDLNGNLMTYAKRGAGSKLKPYVRVRWSNPGAHLNSEGKETKYEQPAGAPARLYIPQRIRQAYQDEERIETLIVQEGEKKAEKACKHGILSVGIQGIYNIGNEESGLIQDLQYIVQKCSVKNVVLLFDSDWDHLAKHLEQGCRVDSRPNSFFGAARKFKNYVQTLHGVGVSVDIYIGHINENERDDKGIDDLLTNSLKGRESELLADVKSAMLTHDGKGKFVSFHKVTTKSDNQIKDLWSLNDPSAFFDRYRDKLISLPAFRFGYFNYRVEDGKIIQATKTSDTEFWTVDVREDKKKSINFDSYEAIEFVSANGFYRIHTSDLPVDQYKFVRIDGGIVYQSGPTEIRDLVFAYILSASKDKDVRSYFAARLGSLLGPDKLERVRRIEDNFDVFVPHVQKMYYLNGQVEVTAEGMQYSDRILGNVWSDKIISRKFKRVPVIEDIVKNEDGTFKILVNEDSNQCEIWQFIQNTSNFWSKPGYEMTAEDEAEFYTHLVNKITTIGFLLIDYKYQTELKAVVAMDGQLGDVGQSNGRTGKSIIGKALSYMVEQTYIDGRNTKNDDDFIFSNVTLRTRNVFLDDVKVNFDFNRFFAAITGDLAVNPKGMARFVIKNERSPKFYVATNHAINAQDRSAVDRISYMAFSNWYNDAHAPIDDFKHQLFADWDDDQWNLFDNFMLECAMFYLKSMAQGWYRPGRGAVPPPMRDINRRTLKQKMGEAFYQWAEIYFDPSGEHLNERIERKVMYDAFHAAFPDKQFGVTPSNFKDKCVWYCQFKGYHFNISKPNKEGILFSDWKHSHKEESFEGSPDKSGGKEYFCVFTTDKAEGMPF